MTDTLNRATLYRKLAAIAGEIDAVEKDGRNKDQGYTYATPASVFRALKPLLAKYQIGVIPIQNARQDIDTGRTSRSGTPYILTSVDMSYLLVDGESGESLMTSWTGVAGAYGDDKGNAKAQTIALRTFLIQLFQIPAEDADNDPDARGEAPVRRQPQPRTEYVPAPAPKAASGPIDELKRLVATAKDADIKLPVSVAGKVPTKMSAEEIRIAILDLQMAIERAVPTEDHSELFDELDKAGL